VSEEEIKLEIGDWLAGHGCRVYDERRNRQRPDWGVFHVENVTGISPDLLVEGRIRSKVADYRGFIALEIKPCDKHNKLLDGFDAVLKYFADYYLWGARYFIGSTRIEVAVFALTTNFSPKGYLFAGEGQFHWKVVKQGGFEAYPATFTFSRLLWRQRDNVVKRARGLTELPSADRKLKASIHAPEVPNVGVLVAHPNPAKGGLLLMISEMPWHWELASITNDEGEHR
jgi:hypothetical protein